MTDGPARYLCLCCGGLEPEAAEATRGFLRSAVPEHADDCSIQVFSLDGDGSARVVLGAAAVGKLIITAPRAVPVTVMLRVPYFICVLALVGEAHALPSDKEHGLPYIEEAVRGDADGWANALVTWAAAQDALAPPASPSWSERVAVFLAASESEASPPPSISLRFRGSTLRDGEHAFHKPDIMPVVGAGTAARLGDDAIVDLVHFDLETVVLILEKVRHRWMQARAPHVYTLIRLMFLCTYTYEPPQYPDSTSTSGSRSTRAAPTSERPCPQSRPTHLSDTGAWSPRCAHPPRRCSATRRGPRRATSCATLWPGVRVCKGPCGLSGVCTVLAPGRLSLTAIPFPLTPNPP